MKLVVVIPAHNEEKNIYAVVKNIPRTIPGVRSIEVVVVDDSSHDLTYQTARSAGAKVLSHPINLGAGGAALTGITYGQRLNADIIVTLDGDGQHNPKEITRLVKKYHQNRADMIIGSRFMSKTIKKMPLVRKVGNRGFSLVTYLLSGKMVSDTQSGFRLFGPNMIKTLMSVELVGYEFCSETIMIAHSNKLVIEEVPITTIYSKTRQGGQSALNGLEILLRLIYRKLVG